MNDRARFEPERLDQAPHGWQRGRRAGNLERLSVEKVTLNVNRDQRRPIVLRSSVAGNHKFVLKRPNVKVTGGGERLGALLYALPAELIYQCFDSAFEARRKAFSVETPSVWGRRRALVPTRYRSDNDIDAGET